jgi:hypothetical protein
MKLNPAFAALMLSYAAAEGPGYSFTEDIAIKSFDNGKVLVQMQFVQSQVLATSISEWNGKSH